MPLDLDKVGREQTIARTHLVGDLHGNRELGPTLDPGQESSPHERRSSGLSYPDYSKERFSTIINIPPYVIEKFGRKIISN